MSKEILNILLLDRSRCVLGREHNIVWGIGANAREEIQLSDIVEPSACAINADTPADVVNKMNEKSDRLCGYAKVGSENWKSYACEPKMEITCGEAPFITNAEESGFLDLKLRAVNKFCNETTGWTKWAKVAYQASYGYELCGDRLWLARRNLLQTFVNNWQAKFPTTPVNEELLREIAEIISWNIFQMDGLTGLVPGRKLWAKVMDWQKGEVVEFWKIGNK